MQFMRIFLYFIIYSIAGWIYETILCSVSARKFVNRGFLTGPWCPIYGFGALLVIFPLQKFRDDLLPLFLSSMVLTMLLEYVTSYVMEKLFHTRWWDYSEKKFQLNGRICLEGAIAFSVMSVIVVKWVHPWVVAQVAKLNDVVLIVLFCILAVAFVADVVTTTYHVLKMNGKLAQIQKSMDEYVAGQHKRFEQLKTSVQEKLEQAREKEKTSPQPDAQPPALKGKQRQYRRLLRAFPKMETTRFQEAFHWVKQSIQQKNKPKSKPDK